MRLIVLIEVITMCLICLNFYDLFLEHLWSVNWGIRTLQMFCFV